jgi:arylsulfatase A-like enzyme
MWTDFHSPGAFFPQGQRWLAGLSILLLLLVRTAWAEPAGINSDQRALNVVFILADDLGWGELGCYGQQKIPTPHLDRLASQGMRFTRHYSGAPVCAPSRCVLLTGRHMGHAEIRGNIQAQKSFPQFTEGQYPLSARALTVAQVFRKAGYATGAIGKWGLGPVGSTGDPNTQGFDLFFGYNCQALAHSYYPTHLWRNAERVPFNDHPVPGHRPQPSGEVRMEAQTAEHYAPTRMVAEAEQFIAEHRKDRFFLYLAFIEPHVAMHPPKASVDRFPTSWDDEPYRGQNGYLPHPRPRAAYAAMISDLDDHVGRVMQALDSAGLTDRTLVVFTSDNGTTHPAGKNPRFGTGGVDSGFFNSTAGLRGYKGSVYEGGLRVPLIVRLPGRIPAGSVNDHPSYFADWFPTLCDAARLKTPRGLDGQSLWPQLMGRNNPGQHRPMVWVFPEYGGQVAVRMNDFKAVRQRLKTPQPGAWELYDLKSDPNEQKDLAGQHPELIAKAEAILRDQVHENPVFPVPIPGLRPKNPTAP